MKKSSYSKLFALVMLLGISTILFSCDSKKRSSNNNTPQADQKDVSTKRLCIPEAELMMAKGIVGGIPVKQGDIDSKLVLMLISNGQLCTAAPIAKNILLTAAHCVAGDRSNTFAAFYASLSCESGFNRNKNGIGVSSMVVHELYNPKAPADQMLGDIALIQLDGNIPDGYPIYQIADVTSSNMGDLLLYGYGIMGSNLGGRGILRKTKIDAVDYTIDTIDKKVQITQSRGTGICQGDSGGPSLVNVNGQSQILGISSYVVGPKNDICGKEAYQTLASAYKDWIDSKLSQMSR